MMMHSMLRYAMHYSGRITTIGLDMSILKFSEFPLYPNAIHLQLSLPIDEEPAVDTELFDAEERVRGTAR
jgi:hypothetical protein